MGREKSWRLGARMEREKLNPYPPKNAVFRPNVPRRQKPKPVAPSNLSSNSILPVVRDDGWHCQSSPPALSVGRGLQAKHVIFSRVQYNTIIKNSLSTPQLARAFLYE